MTRVPMAVSMAALYLTVLGRVSAWDVAAAAAVGVALGLRFGRPPNGGSAPLWTRAAAALRLPFVILRQVGTGSWQVLQVMLGRVPPDAHGLVEVPMAERTPRGVAVSGLLASISPGSMLIDFDAERRVMRFHVVDARAPSQTVRELQDFYRRHQRPLFP